MTEEKRCLKFTGYIYIPKEEHIEERSLKEMAYRIRNPRPGRIQLFDEYNRKIGGKMKAFRNLGEMQVYLEESFRNRMNDIVKKVRTKK